MTDEEREKRLSIVMNYIVKRIKEMEKSGEENQLLESSMSDNYG